MLLIRVARLEVEHTRNVDWHTRPLMSGDVVVFLLLSAITA
jgi:hypothetical protein